MSSVLRADGDDRTTDGYHAHAGMSSGDAQRDAALQQIMVSARDLGLATIALNSAIAQASKMNPTDVWILSYLEGVAHGTPASPGDIAKITGLTTGAVTGVIDRLEERGFVQRERDPKDRRRIAVVPTEESSRIAQAFAPLVERSMTLCLQYSTSEIHTIISYFEGIINNTNETIERLRQI